MLGELDRFFVSVHPEETLNIYKIDVCLLAEGRFSGTVCISNLDKRKLLEIALLQIVYIRRKFKDV
jgi:hypothetical protein